MVRSRFRLVIRSVLVSRVYTNNLAPIFLFSGDLHPGNCLISRDKAAKGQPLRLHLLDCGLVIEMGPEQHVNLVKILGGTHLVIEISMAY